MQSPPPIPVAEPIEGALATRRRWRAECLWPVVYDLCVVTLIAGMLWVNVFDVRTGWVRVLYGAMAVWLLVSFFMRRFRRWQLTKVGANVPQVGSGINFGLAGLTLCLSVLMLLLALEAGARALPPLSNSSINYPGARYVWPDRYARRNSFGLNADEPPPRGRGPRILVLGDSYVEGAGVSRQQRFCSQLQTLLKQSHPEVQVIAAGRGGWNTQDEQQFLASYGQTLAPDLVIVAYVLNDAEGTGHVASQTNRVEHWLQTRCRSYLCYRLFRLRRGAMAAYWKDIEQLHRPDSDSWRAVVASLEWISTWCQQQNIPCQLVVLPIFTDDAAMGRAVMEQVVARSRQLGFQSYHVLDDFDGRWVDFAVSPYDAHPNAAGHARIAHRISVETLDRSTSPAAKW